MDKSCALQVWSRGLEAPDPPSAPPFLRRFLLYLSHKFENVGSNLPERFPQKSQTINVVPQRL